MRVLAFAIAAALTAFAAPAVAQDHNARFIASTPPDTAIDQILTAVAENITSARTEDGQPLPPLTEAERAQPLLDRELVREVMDIAVASGVGQVCSLDWENRNFLPLMQRERARGDRTQHQLGAIAIIHGMVQGQVAQSGTCTMTGAANAASFYDRKWGARP
ncbi:MAG: hypothetical protein K2X34_06335 [Hyphomonadaceae bacterium]|nr:hypothetical protein [Hyphomonadaceae bacterium]